MNLSELFRVQDSTGQSVSTDDVYLKLLELNVLRGDAWIALTGEVTASYIATVAALYNAEIPFFPANDFIIQDVASLFSEAGIPQQKTIVLEFNGSEISIDSVIDGNSLATRSDILCLYTTSGTTGSPKSLLLTREGVSNSIRGLKKITGQDPWAGQVLHSNYPLFDAFLEEVLLTAHCGGTLIVPNRPLRTDIPGILRLIRDYEITAIDMPTGLFNATGLLNSDFISPQDLAVVIGGQPYATEAVNRFRNSFPNSRIVNTYGPTEASITCSAIELTKESVGKQIIGTPYSKVEWRLLELDPNGASDEGELQLSGIQLSPSVAKDWYSTGDRVRRLPSGHLEYLGRIDAIVKVSGKRVDLAQLSQLFSSELKSRVNVKTVTSPQGIELLEATAYGVQAKRTNEVQMILRELVKHLGVPLIIKTVPNLPLTDRGKERFE